MVGSRAPLMADLPGFYFVPEKTLFLHEII
jgi:hypothetical protein